MTWYKGYYGSWNEPCGVVSIGGSYSRAEFFAKAQEVANQTGRVVTILADRPAPGRGLVGTTYRINPQ